jgi:hypothetical protein
MSHALYFNLCIYKSALSTEREAVGEAKIVIRRLTDERNDVHVCEALFDKACKIASEFEITHFLLAKAGRTTYNPPG